jgi:hypothetical protein
MRERRRSALAGAVGLAAGLAIAVPGLFMYPYNSFAMLLPIPIGLVVAHTLRYRFAHRFWPWDFKRRKIERWRWLVEAPAPPRS